MNEKIRELADEAAKFSAIMALPADESGDKLFVEKFAELIVRECAKFMDENSGYNDSNGCWFPEPEDMLKHFGVE